MKRTLLAVILLLSISLTMRAQNDTTKVNATNPKWHRIEYVSNKSNEVKTEYIVVVDGKEYKTNKTSYERYKNIQRFGGTPCVVKVSTKTGSERIVVL